MTNPYLVECLNWISYLTIMPGSLYLRKCSTCKNRVQTTAFVFMPNAYCSVKYDRRFRSAAVVIPWRQFPLRLHFQNKFHIARPGLTTTHLCLFLLFPFLLVMLKTPPSTPLLAFVYVRVCFQIFLWTTSCPIDVACAWNCTNAKTRNAWCEP